MNATREQQTLDKTASDFDLVDPDSGCTCGERRVDSLIWITDDSFRCETCGQITNVWNH